MQFLNNSYMLYRFTKQKKLKSKKFHARKKNFCVNKSHKIKKKLKNNKKNSQCLRIQIKKKIKVKYFTHEIKNKKLS